TFEDAYGQRTRDELTEIIAVPIPPAEALYFPAEENVGPSSTAIDDGWSILTYDSGDVDVEAVMREAEEIWNQQAMGFSSSTPDDVFKASAQAYYADVDAFWAETAPDFHENVFRPWYENTVLPAISDSANCNRPDSPRCKPGTYLYCAPALVEQTATMRVPIEQDPFLL